MNQSIHRDEQPNHKPGLMGSIQFPTGTNKTQSHLHLKMTNQFTEMNKSVHRDETTNPQARVNGEGPVPAGTNET